MSDRVRKAVIPAAGVGTRFLPFTKAVPKEMVPLGDRPLLHWIVEEGVRAGVEEFIIVTSPGKQAMERYFFPSPQLEAFLEEKGDADRLEQVRRLHTLARFRFVYQPAPLGLGHAVYCARRYVGDEPFLVMLPDDLFLAERPVARQLMEAHARLGTGVIAVEEVPWETVPSYGVIEGEQVAEGLFRLRGMVEKPPVDRAPSNMGIVGRYLLPPEIFSCLERTPPGAKGEIQLTDGMALLLKEQSLHALRFEGERYDCGNPAGLLLAWVQVVGRQAGYRERLLPVIRRMLEQDLGREA